MIFTGIKLIDKSLAQLSWVEDCLPSQDDISVHLSEVRELQESLQHIHKVYPRFNMGKTLLYADLLVSELEELVTDLEG